MRSAKLPMIPILAAVPLLLIAVGGFTQTAEKFPGQPFNGMQITYSVSGVEITDTKDKPGFTTSRNLQGRLKPGILSLTGSAVQSSGYGATVTVKVWVGGKEKPFQKELTRTEGNTAPNTSFNLSVPVEPGAAGGFEIRMDGHYSMGGGHRGLVVRGDFQGLPKPKPDDKAPPKASVRTETFRVYGTVKDTIGRPLPDLRVMVTLGGKEKSVSVSDTGFFEHKADLPVPLSEKDKNAKIRVLFNCLKSGKTWFKLVLFPRPAKLADGIMAIHKFNLDERNKEMEQDIDFASARWTTGALTNIDAPGKLGKISVIFRNIHDAWTFATEKLKVDLSGNIPLLVEIESNEPTVFDFPNRKIRLEEEYTLNVPTNAFTHYHEFGHYVQYTAYDNSYIASAAREGDPRNRAHGGYANDDAGDSFIEGFATFYAGLVAKHRDYAPISTGFMGTFGSLEDPWKVWEHEGKDEEFAFASVLWDLCTKAGLGYAGVWRILKENRATFFLYYEAFINGYPGKKAAINDCFLKHGVYSITTEGNRRYDEGEAFIDVNGNQKWDQGETFIDYSIGTDGRMSMASTPEAVIGQSANYERVDKRYSSYRFPNAFLRLDGEAPAALQVSVDRHDGSLSYSYTAPVFRNRLHLPLLPEEIEADITVGPAGGDDQVSIYSKTTAQITQLFQNTRDADSLDSAAVPPSAGLLEEEGTGSSPVPAAMEADDFLPPAEIFPGPDQLGAAQGGMSTPGAAPGGGGGGGRYSSGGGVTWPVLALGGLLLFSLFCIVGILALRRRGGRAGDLIARLDIFGHDGNNFALEIRGSRITLGRDHHNDVVLDDPKVSGRHIEIFAASGALYVRDLGSANGTFLNGQAVEESVLQSENEITIGRTVIRIVF